MFKRVMFIACACALLTACTLMVGGTVTGLQGSGLVLQNNAGDDLAISADGSFQFVTGLLPTSTYLVTVKTQPSNPAQVCSVANGAGQIKKANVINITVTCVTTEYTVGGTVTGLNGTGVVLRNNGGDDLTINADGSFTFAQLLSTGTAYNVSVQTQPISTPAQTCSVTNASGAVESTAVTTVAVTCRNLVGKYLYIGSPGGISAFGINANNGDLSPVTGAPFPSGSSSALGLHPSGKFIYSTNQGSGIVGASVSAFVVDDATGALLQSLGSPYAAGGASPTDGPIYHPSGNFLYVRKSSLGLTGFAVNQVTGVLSPLPSSGVPTYGSPGRFGINGRYYTPSNPAVGLSTTGNAVSVYDIGTTGFGSLSGSVLTNQTAFGSLTFTPDGRYLYSMSITGRSIAGFSVDAVTGLLTPVGLGQPVFLTATGATTGQMLIDRAGKFAYVLDPNTTFLPSNFGIGSIFTFAIDQVTGVLTQVGAAVSTGGTKAAMRFDPAGNFLLVSNSGTANISVFALDATSGVPVAVAGSPFSTPGTSPGIMVFDPSRKFSYLSDTVAATVTLVNFDATTGAISFGSSVSTASTPSIAPLIVGLQ